MQIVVVDDCSVQSVQYQYIYILEFLVELYTIDGTFNGCVTVTKGHYSILIFFTVIAMCTRQKEDLTQGWNFKII